MKNIILLIALTMVACTKSKDEVAILDSHIDYIFELSIRDTEGKDLLNPNSLNHFKHDEIKVFCFNDGEKKLLYDNQIEPRDFISKKENGTYVISASTGGGVTKEYNQETVGQDTVLLQLSENVVDTIKTEWRFIKSNQFFNTKLWYNGELKWEVGKTRLPIVITK
ncbi:hypothetical protein [Marinifilum caeruleilacunae]|uniref:LPS export ABC transporter periplasmic protein LptC n=1 Tax=Marinifilum caeruleilacunae TaxID=2499076 RepID=A0ABX1X0F3_9BACT|nr:hypothetical protein [Marinifilum caeruleilacunae]NOU61855.1 hypothetical protein [Marinifilum caeruleilacunae]